MNVYSDSIQWNLNQHDITVLRLFQNTKSNKEYIPQSDHIDNQLYETEKTKIRKIYLEFLRNFWLSNITLSTKITGNTTSFCILSTVNDTSKNEIVIQITACIKRLLCCGQDQIHNIELISYERKFFDKIN